MRRDGIHQRRRQAIVRREPELSQTATYGFHLSGIRSRLDDGGNERRERRRRPARVRRQLRVNEVQAEERVLGVLDAPEHVDAAGLARVPLDRRIGIHHGELVGVLGDRELVAGNDRHDREQGTFGLPALGATAGVVMRGLRLDLDLHGLGRALTNERATGEVVTARFDAVIHGGMDRNCATHVRLLVCAKGERRYASRSSRSRAAGEWHRSFETASRANHMRRRPALVFAIAMMTNGSA